MTTNNAPALTMDTLHDTAQYRHLTFRQGLDGWELITFPGGCLVRRGWDHVFAAPDDIADVAARAGADPAYWAGHTTAGTTQSWDEDAFRDWVAEEAEIEGVSEDVDLILDSSLVDLSTEVGARQALADSGLDLTLTHDQAQDLYTWDEAFLVAVRSMVRGLEHYRKNAFAPA